MPFSFIPDFAFGFAGIPSIYADGMEVAKKMSLLLFGTVIDRHTLGT